MRSTIKKRSQRFGWVLCCGLFIVAATSCHKEQYPATVSLPTLRQYIGQDTSLRLFQLALSRAGLDTVLGNGGPYTLFAPDNSAFLAAGLNADVISVYDPLQLSNIIAYHIIPGRIGTATIIGFSSDSVVSLNRQYDPVITLNYYGLFINGIAVTQGNMALADGILHKTGQVAYPPSGNLLQVLDSLPNTTMAAYIYHHSAALTAFAVNPASYFYSNGAPGFSTGNSLGLTSGTILAPSDAAFAAYGFNTTADLAALDSVSRTNLVVACALFGSYFTADFAGGRWVDAYSGVNTGYTQAAGKPKILSLGLTAIYATLPGSNINQRVNLSKGLGAYEFGNDGLTIYGNGILTPPMIVQPNIVTTVGVLHIINQVFAPVGGYTPGHKHI